MLTFCLARLSHLVSFDWCLLVKNVRLTRFKGTVKMIRGQGMPSYRHHDFGNMYIRFSVKFPEKGWTQDEAAFEALRKCLPSPEIINTPPANAMTEPADIEDVDASSKGGFGGATAMDEDEDDGHPHAERVQCASQ